MSASCFDERFKEGCDALERGNVLFAEHRRPVRIDVENGKYVVRSPPSNRNDKLASRAIVT